MRKLQSLYPLFKITQNSRVIHNTISNIYKLLPENEQVHIHIKVVMY